MTTDNIVPFPGASRIADIGCTILGYCIARRPVPAAIVDELIAQPARSPRDMRQKVAVAAMLATARDTDAPETRLLVATLDQWPDTEA